MRVFLSEYLTCGAFVDGGEAKAQLAAEGAAMLRALAADAAAVPGWQIVVTWDAAIGPFGVPGVEVIPVASAKEEEGHFRRLAAEADVTLAIAPEFGGLLEARRRVIDEAGGRSAGASAEAISLCGDKLSLARHLALHGVETISTHECDFGALAGRLEKASAGFVVKPRFGAGSVAVYRVRTRGELASAETAFRGDRPFGDPIVQPFVPGAALSVAAIASAGAIEVFPVGRQRITGDGLLHYEGGSLPSSTGSEAAVAELARRAVAAVPGLHGYVGIDVVLPEEGGGFGPPLVVEINPRLTTSYLGYRQLVAENLAERVSLPELERPPARWRDACVEFTADGGVRVQPSEP